LPIQSLSSSLIINNYTILKKPYSFFGAYNLSKVKYLCIKRGKKIVVFLCLFQNYEALPESINKVSTG
jgi:hypothetical protein